MNQETDTGHDQRHHRGQRVEQERHRRREISDPHPGPGQFVDHAIVGGLSGIHQYVRLGPYSMVGGCSALGQDVPPFMRAAGGYRACLYGVNIIGLKRHGFSEDRIRLLKRVYRALFRSKLRFADAVKQVRDEFDDSKDVRELLAFIDSTKRGVCKGMDEREDE